MTTYKIYQGGIFITTCDAADINTVYRKICDWNGFNIEEAEE